MSTRQAPCFMRVPQAGNSEVNSNKDYWTHSGGSSASVTNDYIEKPQVNITSITGQPRPFAVVTAGQILHRNEQKSTREATAMDLWIIGRDATPTAEATTWEQFLTELDDMAEGGAYDWALARLHRMADTVETTQWVSAGQRAAVATIKAGQRSGRA